MAKEPNPNAFDDDADTAVVNVDMWRSSPTLRDEVSPVDPSPEVPEHVGFSQRYEHISKLGEGGMGLVQLAHDKNVGRDVALKVIREELTSRASVRNRFFREARVQGQLEHPAIVPVYDLGRAPSGQAYFTMKRVKGLTLEQILAGLRRRDPEFFERYSRRRMLTAFSSVCLAMAYVHSRGVVHRDLKPANIMLGDFGEVTVLDWGLAKLPDLDEPSSVQRVILPAGDGSQTAAGSVLGSPGYMPPEQIRNAGAADSRADIYALGAILFELLTLHPMHHGATVDDVFTSTLMGTAGRPSARAPERKIPQAMDDICLRCVALDPSKRPSARELHEAIEAFLDGDRDDERRVEQANRHAVVAYAALQRSDVEEDANLAAQERARALREVNAALALVPTHQQALSTLVKLLADPPRQMPPEAQAELVILQRRERQVGARRASIAYLGWLLVVPLLALQGVRDWVAVGVLTGAMLASAVWTGLLGVQRFAGALWAARVGLALTFIALSCTSVLLGPFVIVPCLVMMAVMVYLNNLRVERGLRLEIVIMGLLALLVPFSLQAFGVAPPSYVFDAEGLRVVPWAVDLNHSYTLITLLLVHVLVLVVGYQLASRSVDAFLGAERGLFVHAWQLRQLIPDEAKDVTLSEGGTPNKDSKPSERRMPAARS